MSEDFDPLAYSQSQAQAAPPAFDPLAYAQAVAADPERKTEAAALPKMKHDPFTDAMEQPHDLDELAHGAASGFYHSVVGGYKGLVTLAATRDPDQAADAVSAETGKTYRPNLTPQLSAALKVVPNPLAIPAKVGAKLGDFSAEHGGSPGLSTALDVGPQALAMLAGPIAGRRAVGEAAAAPVLDAQTVVQKAAEQSKQSMGAAAAATDVSSASPQLKEAISKTNPRNVDPTALDNHLEAEKHGVQLMKGQANRDPVQFSEEQNQSTHPAIAKRLNDQNENLTNALDNIRVDASPTNVANSARENGQVVLDSLKSYDEPIKAGITEKYKALSDANGGSIPIDTGSAISGIDAQLQKGFLTKTAQSNGPISEVMDSLRSGHPIDFESFENARTRLAEVQRRGGPEGVAAGIVRNQLEQIPMPASAAPLKSLADTARSAAANRFQELKADPAYQAAVDDVASGTKKGAPSALADTFLDDYALNRGAPKVQIDSMMGKLDDEGRGAVASHTLSAIRKTAINPKGDVLPSGLPKAMEKYGDKIGSLVTPETQESLESLNRVIQNAKSPPPGSSIAPKSGVIVRDALLGAAEHGANAKTLGAYGFAKRLLTKDKFANDALAPGAGIDRSK